jgi:hypothetical protein
MTFSSRFLLAALLSLLLPALAAAQNGPASSEAYIDQANVSNAADIYQDGTNHFGIIGQGRFDFSDTSLDPGFSVTAGTATDNVAELEQSGNGQIAQILQGVNGGQAENNRAEQVQNARSNNAQILQGMGGTARLNLALQNQDGAANTAIINQGVRGSGSFGSATRNTTRQTQDGGGLFAQTFQGTSDGTSTDNTAEQFQSGPDNVGMNHAARIWQGTDGGLASGNTALQTQYDGNGNAGHSARIEQGVGRFQGVGSVASNNLAEQLQSGFDNSAQIAQGVDRGQATGNIALQNQSGSFHEALIFQGVRASATSNAARQTQSGVAHVAGIIQEGNGNTAVITQSN